MEDEEQEQTQAQQVDKFKKGMENKLTDVMILALWATMKNNGKRDKRCKGLKRKASSKCCVYCMSHEGTYTSEQVDDGVMGGRHEACKCKVMPVFTEIDNAKLQKEEEKKAEVVITDRSFGKKFGEHAKEWGLEFDKKGRKTFKKIITTIINEADFVVEGSWRNYEKVTFYILKNDVVVANEGKFVTILKDGVQNNERVKSAMFKSKNRS